MWHATAARTASYPAPQYVWSPYGWIVVRYSADTQAPPFVHRAPAVRGTGEPAVASLAGVAHGSDAQEAVASLAGAAQKAVAGARAARGTGERAVVPLAGPAVASLAGAPSAAAAAAADAAAPAAGAAAPAADAAAPSAVSRAPSGSAVGGTSQVNAFKLACGAWCSDSCSRRTMSLRLATDSVAPCVAPERSQMLVPVLSWC